MRGTGTVLDAAAHHVRVSDGTELSGDTLIIATGSAPRPLPGLDFDGQRILNSDHVLALEEVPPRVVIIGAGAVGCEFASLLGDLGTEVTLLEALPRLLPGADADASDALQRSLKKHGINCHSGVRVTSIEGTHELTVGYELPEGAATTVVDKVIVSIGRSARTDGLEAAGIPLDSARCVAVDDHLRTSLPDVYAVGDVVATPQLAHVGVLRGDRRDPHDPPGGPRADQLRQRALGHLLAA